MDLKIQKKVLVFAIIFTVLLSSGCIKDIGPNKNDINEECNEELIDGLCTVANLPEKFNWKNYGCKNWLTSVKLQRGCGSCWAFSTIGSIEAKYKIEQNNSMTDIDLSEQYLVSDCFKNGSCNGGLNGIALDYIKNNGTSDEECFEYTGKDSSCNERCSDWNNRLWAIDNYAPVARSIEEIKRGLICHGPLVSGSANWGHAVILVGWNDVEHSWIIKNSWGLGWEDDGYGRIPYSNHNYSDVINFTYYVEGVHKI